MLDLDTLVRFLLDAKCRTYAAQGDEATVSPLLPGTKQLEYRSGPLVYRDVYVGFAYFAGLEMVYDGDAPVWTMSYAGGVVDQRADARALYAFLRAALRQVEPQRPYRGPARYVDDRWLYVNEVEGDVERFTGTETIALDGRRAYTLSYAGGLVR